MAGMATSGTPQSRRNFRARRDVLNELSDMELMERYRLDRQGILYVTDLVREELKSPTSRNMALTPEMKVLVTLRYLTTGKMHPSNEDDLGPSQQSVSCAINRTLNALTTPRIFKKFIHFSQNENELQAIAKEFHDIAGFPGVVGVVDGTHVRITPPKLHEEEYINRKNYHSIIIQFVFDASYMILDVVAKWPGSVNVARIWNESGLERLFANNRIPPGYHLLGDRSYPSKPYLLTPYLYPQPGPQTHYNSALKKTHSIIERGIEQLKSTYHILNTEVRMTPAKTYKVVIVCAMLHNICKARNIVFPLYDIGITDDDTTSDEAASDDDDDDNDDDNDDATAGGDETDMPDDRHPPPNPLPALRARRSGLLFRDDFVMAHFNPDE